ncbi:hypothetical protein AYL99_11779 [Fonsecaea erecta]|uniref:Uncharacterized protein n=1 Tax=Fonsecaea erecta TaxID=1367422 RepID=A0A178Z2J3_9EURO|nr:hypothetical protein AYL99_11779 [Fonsecaea erecta]OAP54019.1 hypothetical protein AYL99_11779 [Fonsecaea erecta]
MSTPLTFFMPPPTAEEIIEALEQEVRRQQEETPEVLFGSPMGHQGYQRLCEQEYSRFSPEEVELYRSGILDPAYWECEAKKFKDLLSEVIWQNILQTKCVNGRAKLDSWRDVAKAYRNRLLRHGCSAQRIREGRLTITDKRYWEEEASRLQGMAALREHEAQEAYLEAYWARISNVQGITPSEAREIEHNELQKVPRTRSRTTARQPTRRSQRLQSNLRKRQGDKVLGEREPGLRNVPPPKITKRRRKGCKGRR